MDYLNFWRIHHVALIFLSDKKNWIENWGSFFPRTIQIKLYNIELYIYDRSCSYFIEFIKKLHPSNCAYSEKLIHLLWPISFCFFTIMWNILKVKTWLSQILCSKMA